MQKLLVIVGPTASGKTSVAIKIAKIMSGEIISADSMQIYRGMDIGTAKASRAEQEEVPHHLLDIRDPGEDFSVADYQRLARASITDIGHRGRLPMLVGGTGLYVRAVIDAYNFIPVETNWQLRQRLKQQAEKEGTVSLHKELQAVAPVAAARIHEHDERRIVRALEVHRATGQSLSYWEMIKPPPPEYNLLMIGLTRPREELYQRIDVRVDAMIDEGLLEEADHLLTQGLDKILIARQAIGYKELFAYLRGEETLEASVAKLKQNTRRYAKRQLTWFRADKRIHWIEISEDTNPEEQILQLLHSK